MDYGPKDKQSDKTCDKLKLNFIVTHLGARGS